MGARRRRPCDGRRLREPACADRSQATACDGEAPVEAAAVRARTMGASFRLRSFGADEHVARDPRIADVLPAATLESVARQLLLRWGVVFRDLARARDHHAAMARFARDVPPDGSTRRDSRRPIRLRVRRRAVRAAGGGRAAARSAARSECRRRAACIARPIRSISPASSPRARASARSLVSASRFGKKQPLTIRWRSDSCFPESR